MKSGITIQELAQQVIERKNRKRDFLVPAGACRLSDAGTTLAVEGREEQYQLTHHASRQLSSWAGIPARYVDRMQTEAPDLFAANVNRWLDIAGPERRMLRTFDRPEVGRAWLSERYKPLDFAPMLEACIPALANAGAEIRSCDLTDDRIYLKAIVPGMTELILPEGAVMGEGHRQYYEVQAGLVISNSETGNGSLSIAPAIHTTGCTNLAVRSERTLRKTHAGAALSGLLEDQTDKAFARYISPKTIAAHAKAVWMTVEDLARAALDGRIFQEEVAQLRVLASQRIEAEPTAAVKYVVDQLNLTDGDQNGILDALAAGETSDFGLTPWSVSSAVTRYSQTVDDYSKATSLELAGGQVLEWNWDKVSAALAS